MKTTTSVPSNALFTSEHDALILQCVNNAEYHSVIAKTGKTFFNWTKISKNDLQAFSSKQIRQHYIRVLDPRLVKTPFSITEEALLVQAVHKYKFKWVKIASEVFNYSRSDAQLSFKFLQMSKEFGWNIRNTKHKCK